jgi:hypothetical protein
MKNLSEMNNNTGKEQVINLACSQTGLSDIVVDKIYESQKLDGKTDQQIIEYFTNITENNEIISSKEFIEGVSNVIKELSLDKKELTIKFLNVLNDFVDDKKIDTINLIDVINEILIVNNPKAKEKLISIIEIPFENYKELNESFDFVIPTEKNENTILLFEGLKEILTKNNQRWGITYHIKNSYNAIMNYINDEISEIELSSKINSVSNEYHLLILNDMLSGNVSPLYKHVSSVKHLVPDLQTLVFDMVLLVNSYMQAHDSSLEFVNRQTYNEYNDSANSFIKNIFSSFVNSQIIDEFDKKKYLETPENCNSNNGELSECNSFYFGKDEVIKQITNLIRNNKLKYNTWNISLKSVVDMINFIKSSSTEFNLKIRPIMRTYITKAYLLTSSVEKADILRKQASSY